MRIPTVTTMVARGFNEEIAVKIRDRISQFVVKFGQGYKPIATMEKINEIMGGFGVEYIQKGSGQNSPAIMYINMGNTYKNTIMWVKGQFRVGCWGDIVEKGSYV